MSTAQTDPARRATCCCGQLQARVVGAPLRVSVCHCLACQRRTGSVFSAQARFPRAAVTISGTSTEYVRTGDEGTKSRFNFCPRCGTTVYFTPEHDLETIAIPVGLFMDPSFPAPNYSAYEERMHSWVNLTGDMEHLA